MNTLQLPRDIEKALQLSWDDMHPLTEKYKSEIAEKLSTIMCVPKKNISCRSKSTLRYLNSVSYRLGLQLYSISAQLSTW